MSDPSLTKAQIEVLRLFFRLPESAGFVLAGGAGLVAVGLSDRPTEDVDLFAPEASIPSAGDALETAAKAKGWSVERVHEADTFRRLIVQVDEEGTMVDLAQDAGPLTEPTITAVGPTYPAPELAARKLLALFDRAALRDFIDVDRVSHVYSNEQLIDIAGSIDEGFDISVLVEMLGGLDRFTDDQISAYGVEPTAMRDRFRLWATEL
ncbi:MAG: nucleotidyl transferase AbiEii/AbiGii toxin family protein [Actinobacteria bacterium]|nr:nucleotidyl transferase AbiEii/AbiGii toxin family protein [Actinomycetota bacterium]